MMHDLTFDAITEIVDEINGEIYEMNEDEERAYVSFEYYAGEAYVNFLDQPIWRSDEDERMEIDEENEVYEPLGTFLRRAITDVVADVSKIQFPGIEA